MLNHVVLIGRLTKDPEINYTQTGKAVAQFRMAVDRGTIDQQGNRETDFINIVAWEKTAEAAANFLQKGRLVAIQGRLQIRQYQTNEGQLRERTEVVASQVRFLERIAKQETSVQSESTPYVPGEDDDVPF